MNRVGLIKLGVIPLMALMSLWSLWFVGGFLFTPLVDREANKPAGDRLWGKILAFKAATGHFPASENDLLTSTAFSDSDRRLFLGRHFGHRKFTYFIDERLGACLGLATRPGTLSGLILWRVRSIAEPDGPANESQPSSSSSNSTSDPAGSRR